MNRRRFVRILSASAAGAALGETAPAFAARAGRVAPSDQVNVGVIGVGSQGKAVMRELLRVPGVRVGALCDVYAPRFTEGRQVTGEDTPAYTDYRRMLDERAGQLDAVLIASPLSLHAEHAVAALERGCHVYGEKSMAYDLEGCRQIVEATRNSGRLFQVGHQYRYAPWVREAIRLIHAGEIGDVTHIFGYWHRNNNWRRPVPEEPIPGWSAAGLERLINWRLYRESSRGLLAELGSHQIDFANWIFGALPQAAVGTGGIVAYRDGRETFDHVQVTYEYPGGRQLVFSSLLNNYRMGYQLWVVGTGGSVEITFDDATVYYEPSRANSAVPSDRRRYPEVAVREGVTTGPTNSVTTRGDRPYRGEGAKVQVPGEALSAGLLAAGSFIRSVREGERPWTDELVGWGSAVPVIFGDQATRVGGRMEFGQHMEVLPAGLR